MIVVGALLGAPAAAFKISPFTAEMAPAGSRATLDYVVENDSSDPTAVQIGVVKREQAEDGSETLPSAEDQFLVFPAQLVLLPREKRTVRVQWLGPVNPDKELAYRLIAEQLPVDLGRPGSAVNSLKLLVKYQTAVYILPPGIHSDPARDLVVQRAEPGRDPRGRATLDLSVANRGLAHINLRGVRVTVTSSGDGKSVILSSPGQVGAMVGENVLPGSVRRFAIAWPPELPIGPVTATLEVQGAP
ncbi:MAG: fimbria/pilus periplasmic chaperone [Rhizomicrobium sp.]